MSIRPEIDPHGAPLPDGMGYTRIVSQALLDECGRAIGRPLWDHEVRLLDNLLVELRRKNVKAVKHKKVNQLHSVDEVVSIFIQRIKLMEDEQAKAKIVVP